MGNREVLNGADYNERLQRTLARMKLEGLRNRIARRFDRCCHPGKPGDGVLYLRRMFREMKE